VSQTVQQDEHPAVVEKLSLLDRRLPVSIGIAMAIGCWFAEAIFLSAFVTLWACGVSRF
jgi:hypothetical protein